MAITLEEISDAIEGTLSSVAERSQSVDELSDSIQDLPMLRVFPFGGRADVSSTNADRSTFGGRGGVEATPLRQKRYTIYADFYAQQRSYIGEDMDATITGANAIENILEQQNTKPYFDLAGIRSFNWQWNVTVFQWGDPALPYLGARFTIEVLVF